MQLRLAFQTNDGQLEQTITNRRSVGQPIVRSQVNILRVTLERDTGHKFGEFSSKRDSAIFLLKDQHVDRWAIKLPEKYPDIRLTNVTYVHYVT